MARTRYDRLALAAGAAMAWQAQAAAPTTLGDAIAMVRAGSPEIAAQREQLVADRAQIAVVRAPARPKVQATGNFTQGTNAANVSSGFDRTFDANLFASLPVYDGGAAHAGVAAQRQWVASSAATVTATENRVVTDAVTAYVDVLRDREIAALTARNLQLLDDELTGNRRRFAEGDVTRTDVSQTQTRRSLAANRLADTQARLAVSEETYRRLVGAEAGALAPPPPLPPLPDEATAEAGASARDPRGVAARADANAARAAIRVARASARPTFTVTGGGEYHNYTQSPVGYTPQRGGGAEVSGALTYPIYQGGLVRAQIRQARALATKADFDARATDRLVTADVRIALARRAASLRAITETENAVSFERDALFGTRTEAKGGERTVLDVLNAELELLDAEVALVNARHDAYVGGVGVLAALDRLDCLGRPGSPCRLQP